MSIRVIDSNGNLKMQVVSLASTTIANAINAVGAGTQTLTGGTLIFSNANGVSFGIDGSTLTASAAGGGGAAVSISAGTQSTTIGSLVFSNSNGVSFGLSNNSVTASFSAPAQSTQPVAISGSNGSFAFSTASFGNLNGLSFYTSNGSMVGSYTVPTVTNSAWTVSDGATSGTVARLAFTNSNGITLSLSTGAGGSHTIVGSHNGLTSQSNQAFSAGAASSAFQTLSFQDSNGISFSNNAGAIRLTHDLQYTSNTSAITSNALNTSASRVINLVAATNNTGGGTASLSSNVSFSNANNISFYTSAGNAIVASFSQSVDTGKAGTGFTSAGANISLNGTLNTNGLSLSASVAAQTNQTANFYVSGNTTQLSSTAGIDLRSVSFEGAGIASVGVSNGRVLVSVPSGGGGGVAISGGANSQSTGTVNFANSNGITFGLSNNGTMTASHNGITSQSNQNISLFALGNTTQNSSTLLNASNLSFNAIGSLTVGYSNGSIQLSAPNALTSQTNQNISLYALGNTTQNSSTLLNASNLSFNAIGSLTVGYSNGSIQLSAPNALTSQSNQAFSAGAASSTFQTLSLQDSNGISFSNNAGAIRLTHDLQYTSATSAITSNALNTSVSRVINLIAATNNTGGGTVSLSSNVSFSNANNISFYTSAGNAIVASFSQTIDTNKAGTGFTSAGNNIGLSGTLNTNGLSLSATVAAQSNQNVSLYGLGNTTQNSSTVLNASNLSFNAIGSLTVGFSNGSIQLSAPNALTSQSNQAFSAGAASSAFQTLSFQDSNGISFSNNAGAIRLTHDLQYTSATSAITSNALNTSVSRVINLIAATNNTGGGTASLSSNVSFSNANGATFYTSAGNAIALSYSVPTQSNQNISLYGLGNTTQNSSTVLNASNLSFNAIGSLTVGYSNGSIQLSAPNALTSQSNQVMTLFATGNTTQNSSTTFNASSLLLNGAGAASVGFSNGSLVISAPSAAAGNVTFSAGAASAGLASLVFSNSNGVSFGLNGSTITASAAAGGGGVNIAASNTTFTSGTVVLSNNGGALTISSGAQSVLFSVPATSSLSATGKVSISVNGSTISIGVPNPYISSYQNLPAIVASSAMTWGGTSLSHAAAFQVPEQVSFSFMRIPALMTTNSTTIATLASATASASGALYSTINAVIYSLGSGASSKSLQYVTSGVGNYTFSQQISVTNSTQGSYSLGLTAELEGGARTNLTTQYSISNTNYSFTTNQFTVFTSARFLDIPLAGSLSAGPYWAIIGMSSSSASGGAAGLAALTNCNVRYSAHYGVSQAVLSIAPMGAANKTIAYLGAGSFSTAGGGTINSLNVTQLSSMASNAMMYFQLLRSA